MNKKLASLVAVMLAGIALAISPFVLRSDESQTSPAIHLQHVSAQDQDERQVYALPGTLELAQNQPFGNFLVGSDGTRYGVVGQTPEIEQQLDQYRLLGPDVIVKVWGTLYYGVTVPEIIVSAAQLDDPSILDALTPQPTPTSAAPVISVISQVINVRSGPGTGYAVIGSLVLNNVCPIIGRSADSTWWQVRCTNGLTGWVFNSIVDVIGDTGQIPVVAAPPLPPTPTPVPTVAVSFADWKTSFYNNRTLAGDPVSVLDVGSIAFDWGTSAPLNGVSADNFSVRFERTLNFASGNSEFVARYDDGIRVWVDNELIIDDWREGSVRESRVTRSLSGSHYVRVDYFEAGNVASVSLAINAVAGGSSGGTVVQPGSGDWASTYYNNTDLSGNASLIRQEGRGGYPYDRDWGSGSPAPGIVPNDNWSARYRGSFYFDPGDYRFYARSDDGVRVYIDGLRVIDAWNDGTKEVNNKFFGVGSGSHEITIEFYERSGNAYTRVWWSKENTGGSDGGLHRDE